MRSRNEGFFSKNEPKNIKVNHNSTGDLNLQWDYSENNKGSQLLIENTALVLKGPLPFIRADGREDRYAFNILDIQPEKNILTIMGISISDGLSLKNAMQTKNLPSVIDILRSMRGETCYAASNCLILRFDITERPIINFHINDENANTFRP